MQYAVQLQVQGANNHFLITWIVQSNLGKYDPEAFFTLNKSLKCQ